VALFQEQKPPISAVIQKPIFLYYNEERAFNNSSPTLSLDKDAVQTESWILCFAPNDTSNAYPASS
jgi:hypothetical protein